MTPTASYKRDSASISELSAFRMYWRDSDGYPKENSGNDHIFMPVIVTYRWNDLTKKRQFSTVFRAAIGSGPEDGRVDLDEIDGVSIDDFHLRFVPRYQVYEFDATSSSLTISGTSGKMGGRYEVEITPKIPEPS